MSVVKILARASCLLVFCVALTIAPGTAAPSADGTLAAIRSLAVTSGSYAGAIRLSQGGGINWYFDNVALANALPALAPEVRRYLDAFLRNLDRETFAINDIAANNNGSLAGPQTPDSHDAYAGTFLLLLARYVEATHDLAWWRTNRDVIKDYAYANILTQVKANGLVRTYQTEHRPAEIDPHEAQIAYLIDNCEDYAGLRALVTLMKADKDADAAYYEGFVEPLGDAIAELFDEAAGAWRPSDDVPGVKSDFYPDCLAQVYPALYGVATAAPAEDRRRRTLAYKFLRQKCHPTRSAQDSQRLAIAAYALTLENDPRYARDIAGNALEAADLPALAWRLLIVRSSRSL